MSERPILWWYASGEQKFGPYSEAQLRGLVQAGHVRHGDLIWHHGLDGWVPAHSIEGLLPAHSPLPPALPPQLPAETSDEPDAQPDAFLATATPSDPWPSHADPAAAAAPAYRSSADPMALFVGGNYAFYARRWAESERLGGVISWNWAAFFVSLPWLAYRKMYWHCGIIIAAGLLLMGTAQMMQIPPEKVLQWQVNAAPIFSMLMGLFSNWMYRKHAERTIRQITATYSDPEQRSLQLAQQGGASMTSAAAIVAIAFVLPMLVSTLIAQFMGTPQP